MVVGGVLISDHSSDESTPADETATRLQKIARDKLSPTGHCSFVTVPLPLLRLMTFKALSA